MLTQAFGRSALRDTTGHDAALDIVNEVLHVTGHRVVIALVIGFPMTIRLCTQSERQTPTGPA
jgi:hypothetical protein